MSRTAVATRFVDLVPAATRRGWSAAGNYPDRDLYTLFGEHCRRHPGKAAVVDPAGSVSYAELDALARRLAVGLCRLGVAPGDVVAVQLPNGRLACAVDLAIAAVGGISLPYPVSRGRRDAASLLRRSEAVAVLTVAEHDDLPCAAHVRELATQLPALRAVVAAGSGTPAGCVPLRTLLGADAEDFRPHRSDPDAPARILVTSGSETEPKMVLYSHNALAGGRGAMISAISAHHDPAEMRNFFLVPLASAFGASATPVTIATLGATLVLTERFDPAAALAALQRERPTHLLGVPTMLRMLLDHPRIAETDTSSLRAVVLGGSPLDEPTARRGRAVLGCPVVHLYGSADGVNCHTAPDDPPERITTVGRPRAALARIRIVDAQLRDLPPGRSGEILALGPMSPLCYVGDPTLDRRYRTPGGWVRTGDLGRLDADGYLTVVGRLKDVVIRGGLNISPAEIEALIITHPAVTDVACVPVEDPVLGERLCACVATSVPLSLAELVAHLADQGLEPRKLPERLVRLAELPLSPAGKVDRRALQAIATRQGTPAQAQRSSMLSGMSTCSTNATTATTIAPKKAAG